MNTPNNVNLLTNAELLRVYSRMQLDDTGLCLNGTPNKVSRGLSGYKVFTERSSSLNKRVSVLAHCVAWRVRNEFAKIPDNRCVSHVCGESYCCVHLELADSNLNDSRKFCHNEKLWKLDNCPHKSVVFDGKPLRSCNLKRKHVKMTSRKILQNYIDAKKRKTSNKKKKTVFISQFFFPKRITLNDFISRGRN